MDPSPPTYGSPEQDLIAFFEQGVPFHVLLGLRIDALGDGTCRVRIPPRADLVGDPNRPALHGGVISAAADAAGGLAVFSRSQPNDRVSTVDLRVDYLRPARIDQPILLDCRVLRMGNKVAVADTVVHQGDADAPVARSTAVYSVVRAEAAHNPDA